MTYSEHIPPRKGSEMILKNMFSHLFHPKPTSAKVAAVGARARSRGVDVRSLKPTPPLTDDEKAARYRAGRVAEMSDAQAGL